LASPIRPWPYAAKAVVQFEWVPNIITLWVIFRHPMDQTVKPPRAKWLLLIDGAPSIPTTSVWIDEWTLKLTKILIFAHPATVTLEYDGPDENLRTTWGKQWEPWGPILATDVPYGWEHILEVDVPNERVTINGMLLLAHKNVNVGVYNDLDVAGVNILRLTSFSGEIIIHGFANGVDNQILFLPIMIHTANNITLKHSSGAGTQKIRLHAGADETLTNEYGGWILCCYGNTWLDISHAKHV